MRGVIATNLNVLYWSLDRSIFTVSARSPGVHPVIRGWWGVVRGVIATNLNVLYRCLDWSIFTVSARSPGVDPVVRGWWGVPLFHLHISIET